MTAALEDAALEERRASEREESFDALYRQYAGDVYRFAFRLVGTREDAEDVMQIVFLNAYRALARGNRPANKRAWLVAIAHHVCCRRFRRQARFPRDTELDPELAAPLTEDGPTADEIRAALRQLKLQQRRALVMRELEGLSYADLSAELGLSVPAVETLLFRARRAMRARLERADLTPCVASAQRRRRRLGVLLPFPASLERALGWLGLSLGRAGVAGKVAATVGAAAVGAGVAASWAGGLPRSTLAFGSSVPAPIASKGWTETRPAPAARARLENRPQPQQSSRPPEPSEPLTSRVAKTASATSAPSPDEPSTLGLQAASLPALPSLPELPAVTPPELRVPSLPAPPPSLPQPPPPPLP